MTYDHELTLVKDVFIDDGLGGRIPGEPEKTPILCKLKSIGRDEFYKADASGLKPEIVFVIHGYEYNGVEKVEFEGNEYRVIRTYSEGIEEMELVCERWKK